MTADEVRKALRKKFSDNRQYVVAEEVGLTTGYSHRRLDMVVMDCFESNRLRIDGFEIKVSVEDLRRELSDPDKHTAFFDKIDYFTLACPAEVVKPLIDVIPKKWGIIIVYEDGNTRYKRKPLALEDVSDKKLSRGFVASFIRSVQNNRTTDEEVKEAYENGVAEGKKSIGYQSRTVQENYEKISRYNDLMARFRIWNMNDMDKSIKQFEAFRKLRVDDLKGIFKDVKANLSGIEELLKDVSQSS